MLLYTAGPYRADTREGIAANIQAAREVAIKLWEAGHVVICPHLNTAHFEADSGLSDEVYLDGDLRILVRCDGLVMLEGWEKSEGSRGEHDYAIKHSIPIWYWPDAPDLDPVEVRCPEQVEAFINALMRMHRTSLKKNRDYSSANILGTGEVGLVTRLWDKVARLLNLTGFRLRVEAGEYERPRIAQHESLDDTYLDLANYAVIGMLLRQGKWGR